MRTARKRRSWGRAHHTGRVRVGDLDVDHPLAALRLEQLLHEPGLADVAGHLAPRILGWRSLLEEKQLLPLTTWFPAFQLIGQAKTGLSSLELSRHLGVNDDTTWLLHNKILLAMTERDEAYLLRGKIPMDDADLGGERPAGKAS